MAQSANKAKTAPQTKPHVQTPAPSPALLEITSGPVVEYVSSHHAVIGWVTNTGSSTLLHYGVFKNNLTFSGQPGLPLARKVHRVEISKLKPNTTYYFQVTSAIKKTGAVTSEIDSFKTTGRGDRPIRMPEPQ